MDVVKECVAFICRDKDLAYSI